MAREIAEAPPTGVGRLLEHNRFVVPNHQRDYSWTEDQVRQYLDDIEDANERADEQYFIGLMVFMRANGDGFVVLDGQQRLATTVLIMAAIRTWLKGYSAFEHEAGKIQHAFIGREEIGERHSQPRLVLNA